MRIESSGKPDAWKLARPVWGWGRGAIPRPTPLRTLLLFVTLCAVLFSWLSMNIVRARNHQEAIKLLRGLGAHVVFDYQLDSPPNPKPCGVAWLPSWLPSWLGPTIYDVSAVRFSPDRDVTATGLQQLKWLRGLEILDLSGTQVTDAGLLQLQGVAGLSTLHLDATQISDAGLKNLGTLNNLQSLSVRKTQISDDGLVHLEPLKNLEDVDLGNTHITDEGLKELRSLRKLRSLKLNGTQITDEGLNQLSGLDDLQSLDLYGTKVTHKGVDDLRKKLPHCDIGGGAR
jgi:hypothetical protein